MTVPHKRIWTKAQIACHALEMLAIGNVASRRAQARNRALGIPNFYSIAGRIVSDAEVKNPRPTAGECELL
jgi:hypothetical protein